MHRAISSLLILVVLMQAACVQLAEMDASRLPRYQSMIGRQFALKEDLQVKGVKRDLRSLHPDYAMLVGTPGIGGPEFFELGVKPAGSRFTITGVVIHKSQLFPATAYVVKFSDGVPVARGISEVRISDQNGFHFHDKPLSPEEAPQLSARFFAPVDPK